jgi:hypothetical protein
MDDMEKEDNSETLKCIYHEAKDAFLDSWRHKQSLLANCQIYLSIYVLLLGMGILKADYVFNVISINSEKCKPLIFVLFISYLFLFYSIVRGLWCSVSAVRMRGIYRTFPKINDLAEDLSEKNVRVYYKSLTNDFSKSQIQNTKLNEEKAGELNLVHEYLKGVVVSAMILGAVILIFKLLGG